MFTRVLHSFLILTFLAFTSCHVQREGDLTGEVFIVTQGGDNKKLGLVQVGLFKPDIILPHLQKKSAEVDAEVARIRNDLATRAMWPEEKLQLYTQIDQLLSGESYFQNMPAADFV